MPSARLLSVATALPRFTITQSEAKSAAKAMFRGRSALFDRSAWLAGIVRHAALDLARKRGRELPTDDPALGDIPVAPEALEAVAASAEGRRLLKAAVKSAREHFLGEEKHVFPLLEKTLQPETLEELGRSWLQRDGARAASQ